MCHYRSKVPTVLIAITVLHVNLCYMSTSRRDAAQWLERDSLLMSLPVVRFQTRLGAEYSEKCHVSPLSMFEHMFRCCVRGQNTLPSHASLVSCVKSTLLDRDSNMCDAPKWLQDCMLSVELKWHTND